MEPPPEQLSRPAPGRSAGPQRLNLLNFTALLFLLAVVTAGVTITGSDRPMDYAGNVERILGEAWPPDLSETILEQTGTALVETFRIAVLATFFGILLSLVLAIPAAQNIAPMWVVVPTRLLLNAIRTIPSLVWALLTVIVMGIGEKAGVVALTFYSVGYLGKFFSEAFESVDAEIARGLRSMGASPIQAFQYGLWPSAKPLIWSYSLWMLEYNIRSASIVGYVGAGGIGYLLSTYIEYRDYDKVATVLLCLFIVVAALDFLGERIRKRIVRSQGHSPLASKG